MEIVVGRYMSTRTLCVIYIYCPYTHMHMYTCRIEGLVWPR